MNIYYQLTLDCYYPDHYLLFCDDNAFISVKYVCQILTNVADDNMKLYCPQY